MKPSHQVVLALIASSAQAQEACFERLDNGTDLTGWTRSTTNHHGPGGGWTVEQGALTGRQTSGQQGGIIMTAKKYRDVEVIFEVKIDWGCDSGLFFRTTAGDRAYQVNVDHLEGGGIGTIYGEGFSTELRARDFTLTNQGRGAVVEPGHTPIFDLSRWSTLWNPTDFNEMRARMEGNPPHIQTWVAGVKVMDFTDDRMRSEIDPSGPLAIQVHMGTRWVSGGTVRFRNIRAKDLTVPCASIPDGGSQPDAPSSDGAADADAAASDATTGADATADATVDADAISDDGSVTGDGSTASTDATDMATSPDDASAQPQDGKEADGGINDSLPADSSVADVSPTVDAADLADAATVDGGAAKDAAAPDDMTTASPPAAGCSCALVAPHQPAASALALMLGLTLARARARRRR